MTAFGQEIKRQSDGLRRRRDGERSDGVCIKCARFLASRIGFSSPLLPVSLSLSLPLLVGSSRHLFVDVTVLLLLLLVRQCLYYRTDPLGDRLSG